MGRFFKRHWLLCLILFAIPLIIAGALYYFNRNITITEWLPFLGGLLTYYGTVILGIVTVVQNETITAIQYRGNEIVEKQLWNDNQSWFEMCRIADLSVKPDIEGKLIEEIQEEKRIYKCCFDYQEGFFSEQYKSKKRFITESDRKKTVNDYKHSLILELENKSGIDISLVRVHRSVIDQYDVNGKNLFSEDEYDRYFTFQMVKNKENIKLTFPLNSSLRGAVWRTWMVFHNIYGHRFYQEIIFALFLSEDEKKLSCRAIISSVAPVRIGTINYEPECFVDLISKENAQAGIYPIRDMDLLKEMASDFD